METEKIKSEIQKMTWTAILKRIDDQWKIVNSHETVMGIDS